MPVSKKRKKDGKPVKRAQPPATVEEQSHAPDAAGRPQLRQGKPTNPFVGQQQGRRASQRGR